MKLIDILACELKEWPEDCHAIEQDRRGSCLFKVGGPALATYVGNMAEDADTAKVTRAQWQAAVDALAQPSSPAWVGIGLPPVGTVCEFTGHSLSGEDQTDPDLHVGDQVEIIAHFKAGDFELAAFLFDASAHNKDRGSAYVEQGAHGCFRPIYTAEMVAKQKRHIAAVKMFNIFCEANNLTGADMKGFYALYDAGFLERSYND